MGATNGLRVSTDQKNLWHQFSSERTLEKDFETIVSEYKKINMKLDLILAVFPVKVS